MEYLEKTIEDSKKGKIESDKVIFKDLFSKYWFSIPSYQRSYVWNSEQIGDLLDDLNFAYEHQPNNQYFLGSLVLQKKNVVETTSNIEFALYDVLDGQQRLTTIFILLAVIRDITDDENLKIKCIEYIYKKKDDYENIPGRIRIVYNIREIVETFFEKYIIELGGTLKEKELIELTEEKNVTISNIAKAIIQMRKFFINYNTKKIQDISKFLFNKILFIYVSTENLEDAFRLFTILNDRGIPLGNSDILKSINLAEIKDKDKKAKEWEEIENNMGRDEFDRLLSFIRTLILKDKARENILKEFEEKIYKPTPALLEKGEITINYISNYANIYMKLINFESLPSAIGNEFKNLIIVMRDTLPSTDWIPPLLSYYNKYKNDNLLFFLKKLDNKFSADFISQLDSTTRLKNMNDILKKIETFDNSTQLNNDVGIFTFNVSDFFKNLALDIYNKRFAKYILLKLEFLSIDYTQQFNKFNHISVEHILPQNPPDNSKWWDNFTSEEHKLWLNKLGNLVLLSRIKNSQLSNKDFEEKKKRYFAGNMQTFPNSNLVMHCSDWTLEYLKNRHTKLIKILTDYYSNLIIDKNDWKFF